MPHPHTPRLILSWARVSAILEACRGAGRRAPAVGFAEPVASGSVQGTNLLASDYQDPLPDSTGHHRTARLASADTSQRYALVPDVDGCFR
jgi:hypothetical protein